MRTVYDHMDGTCTVHGDDGTVTHGPIPDCRKMKMDAASWIDTMRDCFNSGFYSWYPEDFTEALRLYDERCVGVVSETDRVWVEYARHNLRIRDWKTGEFIVEKKTGVA